VEFGAVVISVLVTNKRSTLTVFGRQQIPWAELDRRSVLLSDRLTQPLTFL